MRGGIDTSLIHYYNTIQSQPNGTHVANTSCKAALMPSLYVIITIITILIYIISPRGIDLPRIRALLTSLPGNRSSTHPPNRAFPTGPQEPPASNSLPMVRETPYTTVIVFPALFGRFLIDYPVRRYPQILWKKLTLLPGRS